MLRARSHQEKAHSSVLIFLHFGLLMRDNHSSSKSANMYLGRIRVNTFNILQPWLNWTPALWNAQQVGAMLDPEVGSLRQKFKK